MYWFIGMNYPKLLPPAQRVTLRASRQTDLYKDYHFAILLQTSEVSNPLGDDRFSAMFSNPDFQVDQESEVGTGTGLYSEKYLHDPWHYMMWAAEDMRIYEGTRNLL